MAITLYELLAGWIEEWRMFSLLARRDFRLLWIAHTVSILGDYVFFIAMTFWVYARTGSSLAVGAILIVSGAPITLVAPLAGRVVDRWRKTTVMILAETSRAMVFLLLLAILLAWPTSLWPLYVMSCLQSFIAAFFWAARGAILPDLVDNESLTQANALYQFCDGMVRVGAPTLATFVLLAFGAVGVTAFDAATFLLSALCLVLLASKPLSCTKNSLTRRGVTPDPHLKAAANTGASLSAIRILFALGGLISFVAGTFSVLLPILARQQLSAGASMYGAMLTAQALGEVGTSLLLGSLLGRIASGKALAGYFAVGGFALAALPFVHAATFALAALPFVHAATFALALNLCIGATSGALAIYLLTRLQRLTPSTQLGRRLAPFAAIQAFAQLSGIGLASLSMPLLGVVRSFLLNGLLYFCAACWIGLPHAKRLIE